MVERPDGDPARPDTVAPGLYWFDEDGAGKAKILPLHSEQSSGDRLSTVRRTLTVDPEPAERSQGHPEQSRPGYPVVWWDPNSTTLRLGVEARFGIRQAELLSKDAQSSVVEQDLARYRAWRARRDQTVTDAARPSLRVLTVTELAERQVADLVPLATATHAVEPDLVELDRRADRPSGRRFGALVHAVLATMPFDGSADQVREVARLQGRLLGATSQAHS